jgi:hypothetical protein
MSLRTWLIICTVVYAIFGIGLLVAPIPFLAIYGLELNPGGELISRILGSALTAYAVIYATLRDFDSGAARAVLLGSVIYNVVDVIVATGGVLAGTANALGWAVVVLHVFLTAGFGYFLLVRR